MADTLLTKITKKQYNALVTEVIGRSTTSNQTRKLLLYFYKFSKTASPYVGIRPKNEYLAKRLDMGLKAVENCLYSAKKTGLLIVHGRGGQREFKFNHELLERKMLLLVQQRLAKNPVENPVENSVKNDIKNDTNWGKSRELNKCSISDNLVLNKCSDAQITSVISGSNNNDNDNNIFYIKHENLIFLSNIFESYKSNKIPLKNAVYETVRLCDSLRSSHCEPTKVVSHDLCLPDKSGLVQMSLFDYLDYLTSIDEANANTAPKGLEANAISVKLNQKVNLPLFSGNVGEADVKEKVPEVVCSAVATPDSHAQAFTKTYAVASPEPREALCTVKDECHIVSKNNTPHRASHDLTQNPPLSKSPIAGVRLGERLPKRPSSTSPAPFSTPVRADNLELKKRQTRGDYAEATNLLKQLQPSFGSFQITRSLATKTKNMIKIFTSEKILKSVDAYLDAKWINTPSVYNFLSEDILGRFATVIEKPKQNPYADYPDDRLPFQKNVDENLINSGLMPNYMNKELAMKYGIYDLLYDENGRPHKYRDPHTPEHDQWLVEHAKDNPSLLDYDDYSSLRGYIPGSSQYERYKKEIDEGNAHIAELRKRAGLE